MWQAWDNGEQGAALPVSPEHPERATLTWPKVVKLSGVGLFWSGFQACEIDAFTGAADRAESYSARGGTRPSFTALAMALPRLWTCSFS
jgi:hypothetical protein